MIKKIRKAIIPVAGMGTRFLPATKAQPKEMLPVVDKPVIQYIVEEAVAAGIEEIIFVTAIGKRALEDHFDRNFELEYRLEQKNKLKELKKVEEIGRLAKFAFVRQAKPLGDGNAILAAAPFVGPEESVAILFGDDIINGENGGIAELIKHFENTGEPSVAVVEVPKSEVSQYGIIAGELTAQNQWRVRDFVEKPVPAEAPSNLAVIGRYVITPAIIKILTAEEVGEDGEVRLANALAKFVNNAGVLTAIKTKGKRYDCGNKLQFILAQIELGLLHPEVAEGLREYLKNIKL